MTLITPQTNPNDTLVYSKNNCVKCKQTKKIMDMKHVPYVEINIQESEYFDEYLEFLKSGAGALAMPVVYPAVQYNMEPWNDFKPQNINTLALKVQGNG